VAVISTAENSGFIPEIFLGTALGRLKNYLTLQRTVTTDKDLPTGESFSVGKTLHLPKRGTLTVNQKTETGSYVSQNPQSSTVDLSLNHHPEVTFALTSEAIAFQNQDVAQGYVDDALIALAEDVDTNLMNVWKLAATANTVTNAGTISEANILSARKILQDNKVGPLSKRFGIVSTAQEAAVLQLANLSRFDAVGIAGNTSDAMIGNGGAVTLPGAIGRAYGFEIAPSQLVPSVAGNDNSLQTIAITGAPTGGSFTVTIGGVTSGPIAYNASAAAVQAAIAAMSSVGAGNVYVTLSGSTYTVALLQNAATITTTNSFTGGATPNTTIAQVSQTIGAKNLFYTPDSVLLAFRALPLPEPGSGAVGTVMTDPETGLTIRMVRSWNSDKGYPQISLDLLYGFNVMRGEHLVLVQTS
jgi:hypothetical protein